VSARDIAKTAVFLWAAVLFQVALFGGLGLLAPNLALVGVVCVALLRGPVVGASAGFAAGLLLDVATLSPVLGVSSLVLATAGFWIGRYGETTGRDRRYAPYLAVAVASVAVPVVTLVLDLMLQEPVFVQRVLFHALPARLVVDVAFAWPVYRIARRLLRRGGSLERTAEVRLLG
jgi:rod shape-determining protein MreD